MPRNKIKTDSQQVRRAARKAALAESRKDEIVIIGPVRPFKRGQAGSPVIRRSEVTEQKYDEAYAALINWNSDTYKDNDGQRRLFRKPIKVISFKAGGNGV